MIVFRFLKAAILALLLTVISCSSEKEARGPVLYKKYCTSCHVAPAINDLPKHLWREAILPDMGARLGIKAPNYNPMKGMSYEEMDIVIKTGIYPDRPLISAKDWEELQSYVLNLAPDTLRATPQQASKDLKQFTAKAVDLDGKESSLITLLQYDGKGDLVIGNLSGLVERFNYKKGSKAPIGAFGSPVIAYTKKGRDNYVTSVGQLQPSEIPSGAIFSGQEDQFSVISETFHRPVHTLVADLNDDGSDELIVSEFGNLTGRLSILSGKSKGDYERSSLLELPGVIRVLDRDMDSDGKKDLIVLTSQGDEGITILYQEDDLRFRQEKALSFSPVYGSSWFELLDFNEDGNIDIVTVHGDNADKSYVHKPYHGMRLHLNDGDNNFNEAYFYPMNGATRVVARDFDQDGDVDFGLLSCFPDYDTRPEYSFVYLENRSEQEIDFQSFTFEKVNVGRWFLMDTGDLDDDGDEDIILSAFSYGFTPVPKELSKYWKEQKVDIMVLENQLF